MINHPKTINEIEKMSLQIVKWRFVGETHERYEVGEP